MCRRLLSLFADLPAADIIRASLAARPIEDAGAFVPDTIPDHFAPFESLLTQYKAAVWRCDRLQAFLLAELDHPRVRMPIPAGCPVRFAINVDKIVRFAPQGCRRWRLQEVLSRRQRASTRGARGLTRAQAQEATLDAAVHEATAPLLAPPGTTLGDISTKIPVHLASQEPGGAFRDASPWGELRSIFADFASPSKRV